MNWTAPAYTAKQLEALSGTPHHKVKHYVTLNLFHPPEGQRRGKGYRVKYSLQNALQLRVMGELSDMGLALAKAQQYYMGMQDMLDLLSRDYALIPERFYWMYVNGENGTVSTNTEETRAWKRVLGVNLKASIDEISQALNEL